MPVSPPTFRPSWIPSARERLKQADRDRGSAHRRGYDKRWQKTSEAYRRFHPLCACCKAHGVIASADVTDHVVPHRGDMKLFWDPANWQSLCRWCHDSVKRALEGLFEQGRVTSDELRLDRIVDLWRPPGLR